MKVMPFFSEMLRRKGRKCLNVNFPNKLIYCSYTIKTYDLARPQVFFMLLCYVFSYAELLKSLNEKNV